MSVIREAGTVFAPRPQTRSARPTGRQRWATRTIGAVVIAGAVVYSTLSLLLDRGALTVPVKRENLFISLAGYGMVESRDNFDIMCDVPGALSILEIVPDGSMVRKGDLLAQLDSSALKAAIAGQKLALAKADAAVVQAKKDLQASKTAIDAYREGAFAQQCLFSAIRRRHCH